MYKDEVTKIYYYQQYEPYMVYNDENEKVINPYFNKETGGRMWDFKGIHCTNENIDDAINYYYEKIANGIKQLDDKENICIDCVPSHNKNEKSSSLIEVIRRLCEKFGFINATSCLKRNYTISKLAMGGDRNIENHLDSIEVNNSQIIRNKNVIVLDDVTTTGNSLLACKQLIKNAGAMSVGCIAIGKTVHHGSY
jgi:DNA modification methylase